MARVLRFRSVGLAFYLICPQGWSVCLGICRLSLGKWRCSEKIAWFIGILVGRMRIQEWNRKYKVVNTRSS